MKEIVPTVDGALVFSMLKLLECFFEPFMPKEVCGLCRTRLLCLASYSSMPAPSTPMALPSFSLGSSVYFCLENKIVFLCGDLVTVCLIPSVSSLKNLSVRVCSHKIDTNDTIIYLLKYHINLKKTLECCLSFDLYLGA